MAPEEGEREGGGVPVRGVGGEKEEGPFDVIGYTCADKGL